MGNPESGDTRADSGIQYCESSPVSSLSAFFFIFQARMRTFPIAIYVETVEVAEGYTSINSIYRRVPKWADLRVVFPEFLSLPQQIRVVNDADVLFLEGGAGMIRSLFLKPGATLVYIDRLPTWKRGMQQARLRSKGLLFRRRRQHIMDDRKHRRCECATSSLR